MSSVRAMKWKEEAKRASDRFAQSKGLAHLEDMSSQNGFDFTLMILIILTFAFPLFALPL